MKVYCSGPFFGISRGKKYKCPSIGNSVYSDLNFGLEIEIALLMNHTLILDAAGCVDAYPLVLN